MEYDGRFIIQKTVDLSLLNDGMTILFVSTCAMLHVWDESITTVSKYINQRVQSDLITPNSIANALEVDVKNLLVSNM